MPIEIRELVIRARIDPGGTAGADPSGEASVEPEPAGQDERCQEVVQTCVREVLRILEDRRER